MVVTGSEHSEGEIVTASTAGNYTDHRCKWNMGLGSSPQQLYSARPLVPETEIVAYQLLGNAGSDIGSATFCTTVEKSKCIDQIRQFNCGTIYQQAGGNKIVDIVPNDMAFVADCSAKQYELGVRPYSGEKQHSGRHSQSPEHTGDGVDYEQNSVESNFQFVGWPQMDLFATVENKQTPTVLLMDATPSSLCAGCPVNCMAEHVCLCLPTTTVDSKVLSHIATVSCTIILITPQRPRQHWYPRLLSMLIACPLQLRR